VESFDEQHVVDAAWEYLRSNSTATIKFNEHTHDVSYVINHEGVLVIPAMVAMLQPCDIVMFVPEYCEDCIEMHVSLKEFNEEGEYASLADRWQVYHGISPDVQWAMLEIDAARFHEAFIDGEQLQRENPLGELESALCKELNKNHVEHLTEICKKHTNVAVQDPVVVGVDPLGFDIRASFGIIRVPAAIPFATHDDVTTFVSGG
jgi:thiol-disulfide isomerase/thioredoxin